MLVSHTNPGYDRYNHMGVVASGCLLLGLAFTMSDILARGIRRRRRPVNPQPA